MNVRCPLLPAVVHGSPFGCGPSTDPSGVPVPSGRGRLRRSGLRDQGLLGGALEGRIMQEPAPELSSPTIRRAGGMPLLPVRYHGRLARRACRRVLRQEVSFSRLRLTSRGDQWTKVYGLCCGLRRPPSGTGCSSPRRTAAAASSISRSSSDTLISSMRRTIGSVRAVSAMSGPSTR